MSAPKVFGIGFHKTGTTSLGVSLERLGFDVCHGAAPIRAAIGQDALLRALHARDLDPIFAAADRFEAFSDVPWFLLYRELDRRFPGSKFILTSRDESRWIRSATKYFGSSSSALREWIYGTGSPVGHEAAWLETYRAHHRDVTGYFRDRPGDLLVVDWERGDGWSELAAFVGRTAPADPFPHLTKDRHTARLDRPPSDLDLDGAIIVLTHPRTGSSLVMQTLRHFGVDVLGELERPDLPLAGNPKGYFEDRALFYDGLHAAGLAAAPAMLRGRAVKFGMQPLVARRSEEEWLALTRRGVSLLLPIRELGESLRSQEALLGTQAAPARNVFHAAAYSYLLEYGFLAERAASGHPMPACIDYALAVDDPESYVRSIARAAGLAPSAAQIDAAIANIDPDLYRVRAAGGADSTRGVGPLASIYERLRGDNPAKWTEIRAFLPAWALGRS